MPRDWTSRDGPVPWSRSLHHHVEDLFPRSFDDAADRTSGRASRRDHGAGAGCLSQRVLRLAEAAAVAARPHRSAVPRMIEVKAA